MLSVLHSALISPRNLEMLSRLFEDVVFVDYLPDCLVVLGPQGDKGVVRPPAEV
jgi:hypothetical protein